MCVSVIPQGSSVLQHVLEFPSFLGLNSVLLCGYTTFCLSLLGSLVFLLCLLWEWLFSVIDFMHRDCKSISFLYLLQQSWLKMT